MVVRIFRTFYTQRLYFSFLIWSLIGNSHRHNGSYEYHKDCGATDIGNENPNACDEKLLTRQNRRHFGLGFAAAENDEEDEDFGTYFT